MTSWRAPEHGEPLDPGWAAAPQGSAYPPAYPVPPGYQPYGPPPYGYPAYGPSTYAYPAHGYPAHGYPAYGCPPPAPGAVRPGMATAASVLAFVLSGLLILAGLVLLLGASIAADLEDAFNSDTHIGVELVFDAVVNLAAGGLLIAGGAMLIGRRANGRILLSVGSGIVVAAAVYWLVRFDHVAGSGWAFYAVVFLVLTALTVVFAWTAPVTQWLRRAA